MKKILVVALISVFSLLTLNACSTVAGVGEDIQGAGGVITKSAEKVKKKM
jgi:predicted small secreted protein